MNRYEVTFVKYYNYTVEAKDEDVAEKEAYHEFRSDCCSPIADTFYDEVLIDCIEEDEEEYEEDE